jgi:peptidoglycan/xylan/chitin deacetylase (PgdA/CDA1 family)
MSPRHAAESVFFLVERLITAFLYPLCLLRARMGREGAVPILMYHQVGRPLPGHGPGREAVPPERFERQMGALLAAGYKAIPLGALFRTPGTPERRSGGRRAVVTFDDGLRGQLENAVPILEHHGVRATFFLIAGAVGSTRPLPHLAPDPSAVGSPPREWLPLDWDEARRLVERGHEIGSHSLTHRSLVGLGRAAIEVEIRGSREILERRLGVPVGLFAYPFGSPACGDCDPRAREPLRRAGYRAACTTAVGRNGPRADPLALRRIPVEPDDGPFRMRCKLAGAYDWVGPVKSLWQRLVPREDRVGAVAPARATVAGR